MTRTHARLFFFAWALASSSWCQGDSLPQKLLNFIAATQLGEAATDSRSVGFWQNRVQAVQVEEFFNETDLFSALHTVMMVQESEQHFPLSGFDQIKGRFAPQM